MFSFRIHPSLARAGALPASFTSNEWPSLLPLPRLIVLVGLSGAGKSSFTGALRANSALPAAAAAAAITEDVDTASPWCVVNQDAMGDRRACEFAVTTALTPAVNLADNVASAAALSAAYATTVAAAAARAAADEAAAGPAEAFLPLHVQQQQQQLQQPPVVTAASAAIDAATATLLSSSAAARAAARQGLSDALVSGSRPALAALLPALLPLPLNQLETQALAGNNNANNKPREQVKAQRDAERDRVAAGVRAWDAALDALGVPRLVVDRTNLTKQQRAHWLNVAAAPQAPDARAVNALTKAEAELNAAAAAIDAVVAVEAVDAAERLQNLRQQLEQDRQGRREQQAAAAPAARAAPAAAPAVAFKPGHVAFTFVDEEEAEEDGVVVNDHNNLNNNAARDNDGAAVAAIAAAAAVADAAAAAANMPTQLPSPALAPAAFGVAPVPLPLRLCVHLLLPAKDSVDRVLARVGHLRLGAQADESPAEARARVGGVVHRQQDEFEAPVASEGFAAVVTVNANDEEQAAVALAAMLGSLTYAAAWDPAPAPAPVLAMQDGNDHELQQQQEQEQEPAAEAESAEALAARRQHSVSAAALAARCMAAGERALRRAREKAAEEAAELQNNGDNNNNNSNFTGARNKFARADDRIRGDHSPDGGRVQHQHQQH